MKLFGTHTKFYIINESKNMHSYCVTVLCVREFHYVEAQSLK
jgi:hypothetical protein